MPDMATIVLGLPVAYMVAGAIFAGWLRVRTWGTPAPCYVFLVAALVWPLPLAPIIRYRQW